MTNLRRLFLSFALFAAGLMGALPAQAQQPAWPSRPVRFIIPLGAGSGVDITARLLADKLSQKWGQPVVVENKPGGDAMLAITAVVNAHDDHVLLFAPASTFTAHPLLHEKLPYKIDDLVPIARVTNTLIAFGVPADLGVSTVKEFAAKAKAEPGKLNYASVTGANDLLFAAFLKTENLNVAKVPYRDTVQAINDLAEGRIQAFVGAYAIMRPRIQAGKVKVIALTNREHAKSLDDYTDGARGGLHLARVRRAGRVAGPEGHAEGGDRPHRGRHQGVRRGSGDQREAGGDRAGRQSGHRRGLRQGPQGAARHSRRDRQGARHQAGAVMTT